MSSNNLLFCSAGRRVRLLMNARETIGKSGSLIMATDLSALAPALAVADKSFLVPPITDPGYIDAVLKICRENNVKAITTLIDPEIAILSANADRFREIGVLPLIPDVESAKYCFNKYELYKYATAKGIAMPLTFHDLDLFKAALNRGKISMPVFMKPVNGSGSVGAHRADTLEQVEKDWYSGDFDYIIQEFIPEGDCDADVYVDTISHRAVAAFTKRKIETRIGGANKTISFKDPVLFAFIRQICDCFAFSGPLDIDFIFHNGKYYLSEINPRFGGAYLHAYGANVNFFKLIDNNINGIENAEQIGDYEDDLIMMMYDDVIFTRRSELLDPDVHVL